MQKIVIIKRSLNFNRKNVKRNFITFIFYIIISHCSTIHAQNSKTLKEFNIQSLTTQEGLFGNQVNCIYQDSKGFIWIGTNMGLNRWDGYEFKIFISDPNDKQCFKNGDIISLIEDIENRLWIGTKSDMAILNLKTLKFETTDIIRNHDSIPPNTRYSSFALQDSTFMWIGSYDGLMKFNLRDYSIKIYKTFPNDSTSLSGETITALRISNSGELWIGTDGKGLNRYNKEKDTFDRFGLFYGKFNTPTDTILRNYSNGSIATISEDLNGNILIGTNSSSRFYQNHPDSAGVFDTYMGYPQLLLESGKISWINKEIIDALPEGIFTNVLRRSRYFLRTKNDFIYFIQDNNRLCKIPFDRFLTDNKFQLSDSAFVKYNYESEINLTCLFLDKDDNLWMGTSYGIKMLPNVGNKFQNIPTLSANKIESIAESKIGDIYLGTNNGGLFKYKITNNNINLLKVTNEHSYCDITFDMNNNLWCTNYYIQIFKLDQSNLLVNYDYKFPPKKSGRVVFNFKIPELNVKNIFEFTIDQKGTFWAEIEDHGFGWIDTTDQTFHEIIPDSIQLMKAKYNISSVFDDKISTLWIGRQGGLIALNYLTKKFEQYIIEKNSWNNPAMLVYGIAKDDSNRIWFGSRANGLYCFIPSSQKFYHFTSSDGIPDNSVRGVVYHKGTIWMSTTNGISRLKIPNYLDNKKQKLEIRNFGLKDGPFADSFNPEVYLKAKDGQIFFSTEKNLITFYPDSMQDNPVVPPVLITELEVNNHDIKPGDITGILKYSITYTDSLFLDYKESTLSFRYSGLNFINPSYNQFAYMLEGFDTTWIYCGNRRFVTYSNLDPGEYVFRVKASNDDGVWNEQGKSLYIIISPPFWQTNWFYSLASIMVIASTTGLYKWRTSSLRKDKQKLEIKVQERTAEIEKEKQKSDDLLLNILPADVMEELKATGKTIARNYDLVTVLFADFQDFTSITEEMAPEDLVSGIDEYFETFDRIVGKYPIEKIKTVGDAYICAAGLPQTSMDNPVIMMDAAFEMVQAIEKLKEKRISEGKTTFDVRIGAHSGPLVAGVVGIKKFSYDIWGDTVNMAARMQQHGEHGKVNVSGTTYNLVKHRFNCTYRGRIEIKHKGDVDMYFIEGRK